ncbi:hypothetical protein EBBID32_43270 [Sphingobium indicum BiD32]|uniref:Uncharacterized protein n=1 Tax=Sphingobium indicum BiD32 TaxID=1301087 RepID=N1MSJ4_9SPHN|nr:hypothetical protein EBBID32_43270 [Sphingobium indicum BiD32]
MATKASARLDERPAKRYDPHMRNLGMRAFQIEWSTLPAISHLMIKSFPWLDAS